MGVVRVGLLALTLLSAGCGGPACAPGTVLVTLSLGGPAQAADALEVTLSVDGAPQTRTVERAPGPSERLALTFAASYPSGPALTLTVTALAAGVPLAQASDRFAAQPSCTARRLSLGSADGACADCQLTALSPEIANAGATVTLEGTFGSWVTVQFPGSGAQVAATVLGPHRAQVVVPADAGDGALTALTAGQAIGPLRFRRASFALGLGRFDPEYAQTNGARPRPFLHQPHDAHPSWLVGDTLYLAEGDTQPALERATLNADGTLSPFTTVPGVTLSAVRQGAVAVRTAGYLWAIGGTDGGAPVATVERASVGAGDSISAFSDVPAVHLVVARQGAAAAVVGSSLYVMGGVDERGELPQSVERAAIAPDGSLSGFELVEGVTVSVGRAEARALVLGSWLYLVGGTRDGTGLASLERAAIGPDGTLGSFAPLASPTLVTGRGGFGALVLGDTLWIAGGASDATHSLSSLEKAPIQPDGTLSAFVTAPAHLDQARAGLSLVTVGNLVHAVGGRDQASGARPLGVEHASLDASGALSAFTTSGALSLATPRWGATVTALGRSVWLAGGVDVDRDYLQSFEHASVDGAGALSALGLVSGLELVAPRGLQGALPTASWLYQVGGTYATSERSALSPDGTVGAPAPVSGVDLVTARGAFATVALGSSLYVIGGYDGNGDLASIERAEIAPDGTLGPFSTAAATLVSPRYWPVVFVSGYFVYVIGGSQQASVERASFNAAGTLASFETVGSVYLVEGRDSAVAVPVGNWLYLLSGYGTDHLTSIEAAPIAADGSLGNFATLGARLGSVHSSGAGLVVGNTLYVLGGYAAGPALAPTETATLE